MKGIVPGRGKIDIDIEYTPRVPETTVLEVELRVAQYRSEPARIAITGCGRYFQKLDSPKEKAGAGQKKEEEEKALKKKNEFRVRVGLRKNRSQVSGSAAGEAPARKKSLKPASRPLGGEGDEAGRER